jgi:undecaprenyl-diphosphatase
MDTVQAMILGIVEGFTEYLPVSSTGHLILTSKILGIAQSDFVKSFEIAIQLGAICAVVLLYRRKLFVDWESMKRIAVAFIPTGIIGLLLYRAIKQYIIGNGAITLWALFLGGIVLIVFELLHTEKDEAAERISYAQSFWIGAFQSLAVIPGVSRSAATIVGGLLMNIKRETIVEFSFLLAAPTMFAATCLDLANNLHAFDAGQARLLGVGFVTSFIVAVIGIKFLLWIVKNHTFVTFGIYRIAIALLFWFVVY